MSRVRVASPNSPRASPDHQLAESSYYPNLNVRVFECLDSLRNSQSPPPELEMWEALLDDLRETGSPEKLQMAKILLLVWVDAWKRAALRAVGPPDWSRVTREYDKLLIEGADGHLVSACTFFCIESPVLLLKLDLYSHLHIPSKLP